MNYGWPWGSPLVFNMRHQMKLLRNMIAFLVLTIAGERLELGKLMALSAQRGHYFLMSAALFSIGIGLSYRLFDLGLRVMGFPFNRESGSGTVAALPLNYTINLLSGNNYLGLFL